MNLESTISILAGGPGSGCKGDNCGKKSSLPEGYRIEKFNSVGTIEKGTGVNYGSGLYHKLIFPEGNSMKFKSRSAAESFAAMHYKTRSTAG